VRQNRPNHTIQLVFEVAKVRKDQINAWLGFLRKQNSAVQNHDLTIEFKHGHIPANFADSAQRNNAKYAWL
jgi:hypothetical protein